MGHPTVSCLSLFSSWPATTHNCKEEGLPLRSLATPGSVFTFHQSRLASSITNKHIAMCTGLGVFPSPQRQVGTGTRTAVLTFQTPPESVFRARLRAVRILSYTRVTWESFWKRELGVSRCGVWSLDSGSPARPQVIQRLRPVNHGSRIRAWAPPLALQGETPCKRSEMWGPLCRSGGSR